MVVYNLKCKLCDIDYVGKTQCHLKKRTSQHMRDVWKVIESGRKNFGPNWSGSGGYTQADAFAIHFAQHCKDATNSNDTRRKLKQIMEPSILWQGDRIRCMKSSRTMQCKICMVERKEILHRFKTDKSKIMNYNSDIFSSCKCCSRFHKFCRVTNPTLTTRMTQKKVPSTRHSKQKRKRFSFDNVNSPKTPITPQSNDESVATPLTPEMASPSTPEAAPVFLIDTNILGFPYRSPTLNPTNLELAQLQYYHSLSNPTMSVEV
jgi:hypothetical protein